jgi:hypothetical protein
LSPILVRPVREQLEHDRVIRLLQAKYKRKFEVGTNPGHAQAVPVTVGSSPWYPDLVLQSTDRGRKLLGIVEVETVESVNNLEAMSQWRTFARLRAKFHLYIPASAVDTAKRLCVSLQISVTEIWAYSWFGEEVRFALVQRSAVRKGRAPAASRAAARPKRPTVSSRTSSSRKAVGKKRPVRSAKRTKAGRSAKVVRVTKSARSTKGVKSKKSTRSTKSAKSTKTARVAKKTSRSSRPKKRK